MKIFKWISYFSLIPIGYLIISLVLSTITIDRKVESKVANKSIYLSSNGFHLDIVIPTQNIDTSLLSGIRYDITEKYLSFGWGDANSYISGETWKDMTLKGAFNALFLKSTSLLHITRHKDKCSNWVEIKVNEYELEKLNAYLQSTFKTDENGKGIILESKGYTSLDDFYKSEGCYSCFKTCNSWVNMGFKESGLKSCVWTPFDFGLLYKYK